MTSPNTIIADMQADVERLEQQRDELIEACEILIIGSCAVGVPHKGEREVLQQTVNHARAVIDSVKGCMRC